MRCLITIQFICVSPFATILGHRSSFDTTNICTHWGWSQPRCFVQFDENHLKTKIHIWNTSGYGPTMHNLSKNSCHVDSATRFVDSWWFHFVFFWEKINFQHNNLNGSTLQKKNNESTWPQLGGGFKAVVFHQPIWNICARQNWIIYPVIGLKIPKKCLKKTPPMA